MKDQLIGVDVDRDGWTTEIVGEVQNDGSLLIVSEHRYKATIEVDRNKIVDRLMEEQAAGLIRQKKATGCLT